MTPSEQFGSVLVTGGTKRIGLAISDGLRSAGINVLAHSRDPDNPYHADFSNLNEVTQLFNTAITDAPDLSVIINNASEYVEKDSSDPSEIERLDNVNSRAPILLSKLFYEHMKKVGRTGCVVNILDSHLFANSYEEVDNHPFLRSRYGLLLHMQEQVANYAPHVRLNGIALGDVLPPDPSTGLHIQAEPTLLPNRPSLTEICLSVFFLLFTPSLIGQIIFLDSGRHERYLEEACA